VSVEIVRPFIPELSEALATPVSLPYLRAKKEKLGHLLTLRTTERNVLA
jgi:hypothetical protein